MDTAVQNAIVAIRLPDAAAQPWFELICDTYGRLTGPEEHNWDDFVRLLTERAMAASVDHGLVDQFVRRMADIDSAPIDTIGQLVEYGSQLPLLHQELTADAMPAGGYDESAWQGFLGEHGVRWNGEDAAWQQFRTWFLYEAGQRNLTEPATGFITYVESMSDKAAAFAQYGVHIAGHAPHDQAPDVSAFPETKHGDSGEWVTYLDAMLTSNGF
jgi:hypothetical protein